MQQHGAVPIGIHPNPLQTRADLFDDQLWGIGLENAAITAQQVEQQQIRDRGAVRNAPAFDPGDAFAGELPPEFGEKPRFADAGLADEADCLPLTAFDLPQEIVQDRQVALPVDENCPASGRGWPEGSARSRHVEQPVSSHRIGLAFEDKRTDRLDPSIALSQFVSRIAQEDCRRLGDLLEAGGNIGGIADSRIFHPQFIGDRAEHHRPGVNPNPHRQIQFIGAAGVLCPAERPLDCQGGEQCALDMVFLRHRGAEERHEAVAGKLRRAASVAIHLGKAGCQK